MQTTRTRQELKDASNDFNKKLRYRILQILDQRSLTTKQLAKDLGYNVSTFSKYFSTESKFPCDVVCAIAQHLHVSVDFLFGTTQSESNRSVYIDDLTAINLSDAALEALSQLHPEDINTLSDLLESGTMRDILSTYGRYRQEVLSHFVGYAKSRWYSSILPTLQDAVAELSDKSFCNANPQDVEQYQHIVDSIPAGDERDLAYASFFIFLSSTMQPGITMSMLRQEKFQSGFELVELLAKFGKIELNNASAKMVLDRLERGLLDTLDNDEKLASKVKDAVTRPSVEKYREELREYI